MNKKSFSAGAALVILLVVFSLFVVFLFISREVVRHSSADKDTLQMIKADIEVVGIKEIHSSSETTFALKDVLSLDEGDAITLVVDKRNDDFALTLKSVLLDRVYEESSVSNLGVVKTDATIYTLEFETFDGETTRVTLDAYNKFYDMKDYKDMSKIVHEHYFTYNGKVYKIDQYNGNLDQLRVVELVRDIEPLGT